MVTAKKLMDMHEVGIFNVANSGAISHEQILQMYKNIVDSSYNMPEFVDVKKLKELTSAGRSNCILCNTRLEGKGIPMRHVLEAVEDCMKQYAKYARK
jgi:3,5-epimerase/4-reductase